MNILFVCSGNTCRSAMAEGIAKALIQSAPERYGFIRVASAGTAACQGTPAASFAQEVAQENGADLHNFASQPVSAELAAAADVVLCMTNSHKRALQALLTQNTDKIYLLKDYIHHLNGDDTSANGAEIADPFGGSKTVYAACYQELKEAITAIFDRLAETRKDLPNT